MVPSLIFRTGQRQNDSIFCLVEKGWDRPILCLVEGINRSGMHGESNIVSYCLVGPTCHTLFIFFLFYLIFFLGVMPYLLPRRDSLPTLARKRHDRHSTGLFTLA